MRHAPDVQRLINAQVSGTSLDIHQAAFALGTALCHVGDDDSTTQARETPAQWRARQRQAESAEAEQRTADRVGEIVGFPEVDDLDVWPRKAPCDDPLSFATDKRECGRCGWPMESHR